MKALTKDVFYHKEKQYGIRLWHTCNCYKSGKRGTIRAELEAIGTDGDTAVYKCPHCGFKYVLDRHLNLA